MKKLAFILALVILMSSFVSCGLVLPEGFFGEQGNAGNNNPPSGGDDDGSGDENGTGSGGENNNGENDNNGENEDNDDPLKDINPSFITINEEEGLYEQIYVRLTALDGFEYKVLYKKDGEDQFHTLDNELIFRDKNKLEFYILGLSAGKYQVKIEAESENMLARKTLSDIEVVAQDRSGYAHFGFDEGIGAYNNDGTVKENAIILYVTNENKNSITLTIDGNEQVGLVNIMQNLHKVDRPVLIRIIGKIITNQWNYKNVEPRLVDGSNNNPTFFENTFSDEYGTNLANLKVQYSDKKAGKTYIYKTTEDGLVLEREKGGSTGTTSYKGSDFPKLSGKAVYDDDSSINVIEVKASKNITIEGVGSDAEFFQFGVGFENCSSIEVKNITFTNYPEDALNFMVDSEEGVDKFGNYWIHNNTFNKGHNAWDITGERDKYAGDGSIDMAFVHSVTLSYNLFDECKKTMLVGNSNSSRCMNISIHHNHFYKVGSRLPLTRNANVHSYNNYFNVCSSGASVRVSSYLFSEANYFKATSKSLVTDGGTVKSYGDIFFSCNKGSAVIATTRDQYVANSCKPDGKTDYSKFDTNPDLFYYDAVNGVTDADYLIGAEDVPEFVEKYAGAGVTERLEMP